MDTPVQDDYSPTTIIQQKQFTLPHKQEIQTLVYSQEGSCPRLGSVDASGKIRTATIVESVVGRAVISSCCVDTGKLTTQLEVSIPSVVEQGWSGLSFHPSQSRQVLYLPSSLKWLQVCCCSHVRQECQLIRCRPTGHAFAAPSLPNTSAVRGTANLHLS